MKVKKTIAVVISAIAITSISIGAYALYTTSGPAPKSTPRGFVMNESFIDGLYNDLDLTDAKEVLRYIFSNLDDEVTIYPTENYFYFTFSASGKTIGGTLSLLAEKAEKGQMNLGYAVKPEDRSRQKYFRMRGNSHEFTAEDSVYVEKVNDFKYTVTFEGRTITFNMFDVGVTPPKKSKLTADEVYVGPCFDESGLRFHLIFNNKVKRLYWVLNEDVFVPEEYTPYSPDVAIGDRTEFAFYLDTANNRKILIGVNGLNVLHNNWYDGPFDQMPDNYVKTGKIKVKPYLDAHYHFHGDMIDKYGRFRKRDNARVPVAPYKVYFSKEDLKFVDSLKALKMPTNEFYAAITKQVYDVPKDYYKDVVAK